MKLFNLKGKLSLITGAAQGIGLYIAKGLAEAGSDVIIADLNVEKGKRAAKDVQKKYGVKSNFFKLDVSKERMVVSVKNKIINDFGKLDILVNNAGVFGPEGSPENMSLEDWHKMIDTDLTSVFLCCREFGKLMIKQKSGKIINISSIYGLVGSDLINVISYHAAKGGVINYTRDLAIKWARHRICVNAIAPGYFSTPFADGPIKKLGKKLMPYIPMKRVGKENDIKGVAVFLASPASDYITGQTIVVDGGWTAR